MLEGFVAVVDKGSFKGNSFFQYSLSLFDWCPFSRFLFNQITTVAQAAIFTTCAGMLYSKPELTQPTTQ